jgi:hypothetical protein
VYRCGPSLFAVIYIVEELDFHTLISMFVYESMSSIGEEVNNMIYNYVGAFSWSMLYCCGPLRCAKEHLLML